jgi:RNA polymerase sigma factor (sigma-70 family)
MRDDPVVTDLVIRASGRDRQAWDALADRYAPLIWRICRRYQLSDADAKHVGQAVGRHLAGHLDSLPDPAALPGWLAATTRRECHRVLRATGHLPADRQDLRTMPDEQTATAGHDLHQAERDAALREAFARLTPDGQRLLALLTCDPPVPDAEISARLGIPVRSIGPNRRYYLDRVRRDPAITRLVSAQAAGRSQAAAPS